MLYLTLLLPVFGFAQSDKAEAAAFAKEIVKSYFDRDCSKYLKSINDSMFIINSKKVYYHPFKKHLTNTDKDCTKFNSVQPFQWEYTFEEYLGDYQIRVYSKAEFTNAKFLIEQKEDEMMAMMLEKFKDSFSDEDYLFVGDHLNDPEKKDKLWHWASWRKIISKTPGGWKITGSMP